MSKTREALKQDVYKPRNWGRFSAGRPLPQPWWGLDTERDTKSGEFVCAWIDDANTSKSFQTLFELGAGTYFAYNLAYDVEGLVRDLGLEEGWAMREDGVTFDLKGYRCTYFHGKRFQWKHANGGPVILLEAASFFNRIPLKEAAKQIGDTKDPVDASKMSLRKYRTDATYRKTVDLYCAKDARLVYLLMKKLDVGFTALGVNMGGTPGGTARRFLVRNKPFPDVIWKTHRAFLQSYCGGRFEVVKRGVFGPSKQYDINSAYPWALSKCPYLTDSATFRRTKRYSDDAHYGTYQVAFDSNEYLGVMPCWRGATRVYSRGEEKGWIARPELDFMQRHGIKHTVLQGVELFDENATDAWRELVEPLWRMKQERKGSPESLGAKVGVNSQYGILVQLIKKGGKWVPIEEAKNPVDFAGLLALEKGPKAFEAGNCYAPCYGSHVTSLVRVKVLDTAIDAGEHNLVATHTDSALLCGGSITVGEKLGDWTLQDEAPELVILKSGQYALGDKVKGRGFSKRKIDPDSDTEVAQRQKVDLWAPRQPRKSRTGVKTATDWKEVSLIRDKPDGVANNFHWELKRKWTKGFDARMIARREWIDSEALRDMGQ